MDYTTFQHNLCHFFSPWASCSFTYSVPFGFVSFLHAINGSLWHNQLGHPYETVLNQFLKSMNTIVLSNTIYSICNACQLGKSHRLRLVNAHSKAGTPFEVMHVDIWRPFTIISSNDMWYFLLFIDDCTIYKWIFFMNNKG